ncbi:hypothetical protein FYK55_25020 [Roseiconus nitratireducens]|uniref:Uncharacterized protein n=1 Tax=Roseiconus nitratireducens TaxID=2605748 RepID=A0A5M6D228_9BACT|nr:hypothetical protein [Roseiconus nitratireducens]KAA5539185.1 hypothetical protein FYK55_25020 [Roseiconus nitratireducens]
MLLPFSSSAGRGFCLLLAITISDCLAGDEWQVESTTHANLGEGSRSQVYEGTVALPAGGLWRALAQESEVEIRELYLTPTQPARLMQLGDRMYAALEDRQLRYGQWDIRYGFEACRQFAQEHQGVGPKSIEELAKDKRWEYLSTNWANKRRQINEFDDLVGETDLEGPTVHLIPSVKFEFAPPETQPNGRQEAQTPREEERWFVPEADRAVLAIELRPFVDDGKHWVLYTDGDCQRVQIDPDLVDSQQVRIRPVINREQLTVDSDQPKWDYRIVLVTTDDVGAPLRLKVFNQVLGKNATIRWDVGDRSESKSTNLRNALSDSRKFAWQPYLLAGSGGVLDVWMQNGQQQIDEVPQRSSSTFSILGGRAAIEETLQLQNLIVGSSEDAESVDVDSLPSVEVKSHPFEQMLDGHPGGDLEMAKYVPPDRFFVYVGKPETLPALLDSGAPFIASMGTALTKNCLQYNLEARYLARLGMSRDWLDAVLASGMTSEMALFTPDLFFIDGTDLTVVAKLAQPQLLQRMLTLLGASQLQSDSIVELPTVDGQPAYLALRDDLLFASTNRDELQRSLHLREQNGEGSLGASTEFRYMLTKLDVTDSTRLYAYLSDPFVRRLVGPRVKIGQRRRVIAKAKMETLAAEALHARLDGYGMPESLSALKNNDQLPQNWSNDDLSLEATGIVRSEHYDTLRRMRTLPEVPLKNVTPQEAEAYRRYVDNYSSYWRRFFDPIGIRLDEVGRNQLELSTFILPLVDNSIYNGLRMVLSDQENGEPLSVPIVQPTPVLQFSGNLREQAWQQIAGNFSEFFTRYSGASSAMLDDFGPSVHVAIFDADPIIAMGSGDVFGAFGGNVLRGGGSEMLMVPVALSVLTRPCSIMVETKSPQRTAQYLRQAALTGIGAERRDRDLNVSFYQVDDRDEWVWTLDVFGVVKLRYGLEVVGNYLVIRNIPWSSDDRVVSVAPAELNGAVLQANPAACKLQLPGLFAAASDANRQAVMSGLGRLYPFMLSGAGSVEQASAEHQRMFGFYPRQFADDRWEWKDFRMVSAKYGEPLRQRQPAFDPEQPFGMMNRIDSIELNMQFEEDGLRSTVRWRLR